MAGSSLSLVACLLVTSLYSFALIRPQKLLILRCLLTIPVVALYLSIPLWICDIQTAALPIALPACILSWLSSFKLIMLAFGRGPLIDPKLDQSLSRFGAVLCLPIRLRPSAGKGVQRNKEGSLNLLGQSLLKVGVLLVTLRITDLWAVLPAQVYHFFWYLNLYLFISTVMNLSGALTSWVLGVELLPDFDRPFLSASLSDFWSKRWNLTVSALLRESVYEPILERAVKGQLVSEAKSGARGGVPNGNARGGAPNGNDAKQGNLKDDPVEREAEKILHGENYSPIVPERRLVPMLAAFAVSGIMHELIFWYVTRTISGEVTAFFVLHGVAVAVERWVRQTYPKAFRFSEPVRILWTLLFCFSTAEWLFLPTLVRSGDDIRVMSELKQVLSFALV